MPNVKERPRIAYQKCYESPLFSVLDFCCHAHKSGPEREEQSENNSIVLMRRGTFAKHYGKRTVVADVNQAVFFSKHSVYRISHPTHHGDRGSCFLIAPQLLNDMIREFDATIDEHPDQPFAFVTGPCDSRLFRKHFEIVRRLERANEDHVESLWVEETVLEWLADVLKCAIESNGRRSQSRRTTTQMDHAEKTEAAKAFLANRLSEGVTLTEIAREVAVSPFNLARIFRQQTGLPIHRYLTQLRLRASLERLSESVTDLTSLALDLGFSSHSHFTHVFHREFHKTPSEVCKENPASKLKEMSKNLIV